MMNPQFQLQRHFSILPVSASLIPGISQSSLQTHLIFFLLSSFFFLFLFLFKAKASEIFFSIHSFFLLSIYEFMNYVFIYVFMYYETLFPSLTSVYPLPRRLKNPKKEGRGGGGNGKLRGLIVAIFCCHFNVIYVGGWEVRVSDGLGLNK